MRYFFLNFCTNAPLKSVFEHLQNLSHEKTLKVIPAPNNSISILIEYAQNLDLAKAALKYLEKNFVI
ncbi:MAG TPA: hypothetical protein DDX92_09935 [Flavobacteriales bacterium]|jgi:hypothetical protein|nr:hypothetical protein [Flavobacteriales bacterium]